MAALEIIHYTDYKSPYAYLAAAETFRLPEDFDVSVDWRPYTLNIPSYLGSVEGRDAHQWRKIKYSYMDCRRMANRRGLTLRGPKQIYDSREANTALLYAKERDGLKAFSELMFERFFNHTIDIEDRAQIKRALGDAGLDAGAFDAFMDGPGGLEHDRHREDAESQGVFGVPAYLLDGELFWGGDRLGALRARLADMGLGR